MVCTACGEMPEVFETVRTMLYWPCEVKVCWGPFEVDVLPSPKFQDAESQVLRLPPF
jgi:hypothetical protein